MLHTEGPVRAYHDRSDDIVEVFKDFGVTADSMLHAVWFQDELTVEKDKQCVLSILTPAQRHGVLYTLKLFSHYEVKAGTDFWRNRFTKIMKGPEFARLSSVYSMQELAIHKPFYQKINEVLGIDTNEFYSSYVEDPVLVDRMSCIDGVLNHKNDLVAMGGFSMVEGGILYSNFAYLKSFSANGFNLIPTICRGINFSIAEESSHQSTSAQCFRMLTAHAKEDGVYGHLYGSEEEVHRTLRQLGHKIYEHEAAIIDRTLALGEVEVTTGADLRVFVQSRINYCLQDLGVDPIFNTEQDNPIGDWFYDNTRGYKSNDFFAGIGAEYVRNWDEESFVFEEFPDELRGVGQQALVTN